MRPLLATVIAFFLLTSPAAASWTWPVSGEVITPYRNGTDPYATGQHRGIDIGAPVGTSVVAAAAGEVRFAGTAGSSGVTVSIRTGDGYDTSYLHLSSLTVRAGAHVRAGDRIGAVGTTGTRSATQPHLHFGVRDAGTRHAYHDPMKFLPPPAAPPRAPDPPPPATAPEPAPAPPAAAPAPARRPQAAPVHRPGPAPRTAPGHLARPVVSHPRPVPLRRVAPHPSPDIATPRPVHATGHSRPANDRSNRTDVYGSRSSAAARAAPEPGRARPSAVPPSGTPSRDLRPHTAATEGAPRSRTTESGRPNVAWALACAGLLLAAGLLGLTEGGRRSTHRRRTRRDEALRPLLGRR